MEGIGGILSSNSALYCRAIAVNIILY